MSKEAIEFIFYLSLHASEDGKGDNHAYVFPKSLDSQLAQVEWKKEWWFLLNAY